MAIKASINRSLSDVQQEAFPDVVRVVRLILKNKIIQDPLWISGFTSGEGCFYVNITKSNTKIGERVQLIFKLTQHSRDEQLLKLLIEYLDCGYLIKQRTYVDFRVSKFHDIVEKIIPFFKQYQIHGVKAKDFEDFCKVVEMMKEKKHLTAPRGGAGLELIRKIKAGMRRKFNSHEDSGKIHYSTLEAKNKPILFSSVKLNIFKNLCVVFFPLTLTPLIVSTLL